MKKISLLLLHLLLCASVGFGQTALATIVGTVSDSTGASIANASIEARNLDTGSEYKTTTTGTGNFTISQMPIGDYGLTVTMAGFKTYSRTKFHLAANQTLNEEVTLEVGATGESIVVSADATLLKTESGELSYNITLTQMNNLPLTPIGATNQGFRDPFNALRLLPGVRYASGGAGNTMIINGMATNSANIRLDGQTTGALTNNALSNIAGSVGQWQPSIDAVEEVAVQTSSFAAEFGTAGGAVINMVTKSGNNAYHGSVYDYMRNEALDAHQPYTGLRNKVRQNDWGFTFGGPVRVPWLYNGTNKTFFFWNFEQYRTNQIVTTGSTTVPIPAYRAGDFTNLITQEARMLTIAAPGNNSANCPSGSAATTAGQCNYLDPLGRTITSGMIFDPLDTVTASNGQVLRNPFPGNKIPIARFDPVSAKILATVPLPFGVNADRGQAGNNYQAPYSLSRVSQIPSIKLDQNIGTKNKVSFFFSQTKTDAPRSPTGADNLPNLITASLTSLSIAYQGRLNWDYTVSPQLLLHFGAGWNDLDFRLGSPTSNYNALQELGLRQTTPKLFPRIVTGTGSTAIGGMAGIGATAGNVTLERRPAVNMTATYVSGRHTYKLGAEYRKEQYPNSSYANSAGTYTFGNNYTTQTSLQGVSTTAGFAGFQLASFLAGGYSNLTMSAPITARTSKSQTGLYIQDNWKATRKLTIDYGLRWDFGTYAREQYGRFSSFTPNIPNPSASGRLGARSFEATCGCNYASNYPYGIGPRLGVSYQIDRKTVVRGGIAVVYNATGQAQGGIVNLGASGTVGFGQVLGVLKNGTPADVNPTWPNFDAGAGQTPGTTIAMPTGVDPNAGRPSRIFQFNLSVQREINRNLVVEAAYVANRGSWLEANGLVLLNQLSQDVLVNNYGFKDFTSANEARLLTQNYGGTALSAAEKSILNSRGIYALPYANFPNSTNSVRQSLLPFPQFTGQTPTGAPLGNSWYDALQINITKRYSHGLSANLNYTLSKSLDLTNSPDPFNRQLGKNLGAFDQPQQTRLTLQYQIPETTKSGLPVLSSRWVSQAVSGWGVGWYATWGSAFLVGRPVSPGAVPISQFLGRGPGNATLKKDANGNAMNPWSVDWTDYSGKHHTDPLDINCHCFDVTKTPVLNPDAWELIPNGQWATNHSSIRSFRGMRQPQESANLSRNFRFGRDNRFNLNVRVEFANIFNRMQYPAIGLGTNFQDAARVQAPNPAVSVQAPNVGLYTAGFGVINPTSGTSGQRTGTFVGRLTF